MRPAPRLLALVLASVLAAAPGCARDRATPKAVDPASAANEPASAANDPAANEPVAEARRIVSLNPSLTAILLALGAGPRLVGVDEFSARQQPSLAALPRVGGLYNPSLEAVLALAPDLVVLVPSAEQRGFRDRLAEMSVPLLVLDPVGFDDVLESIHALGARVGREDEARERTTRIRAVRSAVRRATASLPRPGAVLVLQRDPLFVAGGGSFVDEMLTAAGAENLAAGLSGAWPRASREWLLAAAPDVVLDSSADAESAPDYWKRWSSLPAVREGRVVSLPQGVFTLPGPDLDRALLALARHLHGDALAGLDP